MLWAAVPISRFVAAVALPAVNVHEDDSVSRTLSRGRSVYVVRIVTRDGVVSLAGLLRQRSSRTQYDWRPRLRLRIK